MNKDGIDASLQKLHDGTVGQLNASSRRRVEPFKQGGAEAAVAGPRARSTRWRSSRIYHRPQTLPDGRPAPAPTPQPALEEMVKRTDTVMVVATSVSENVGGKPQTVRWKLRLDVSDVDGKLLISRLETDPMRNRLRVLAFDVARAARRDRRAGLHRHRAGAGRCGGCRCARCCAC